jgi:hypothetical protein
MANLTRSQLIERRRVRSACFRILNHLDKGGILEEIRDDLPEDVLEALPRQKAFNGWRMFAHSWDVIHEDPLTVVPRLFSVWEEWDAEVRSGTPLLPSTWTNGR